MKKSGNYSLKGESPYLAHLARKSLTKNAHLRHVNSAFSSSLCAQPASKSALSQYD